ncbi:MAG: amidohydrolase family protein [Patescibacteria group bacterium]|nr:amidohydrolase family protein [Patescibacteria group bacterium]
MTLLIKNVKLLGAAQNFPGLTDVFVMHDKISAIGPLANKKADDVLDGQGAYLSPGFIDVNAASDHYLTLFDYPSQEDFLKQGVTTILGGSCGSSLAPLLYGNLESLQKWGGSPDKINVNWHSVAEFLEAVDRRRLAVNFGTLIGHATIRRALVGDALRDLTKNELGVFAETLRKALQEGGFGLSTGLGYVHDRVTPYSELKKLAEIVKESGGIYATHLRHSGVGVGGSIDETLKLTKEVGMKTVVNHFIPVKEAGAEYEKALSAIDALPPSIDLRFDIYPFDTMLLPIYTFLPEWAQTGGREIMLANVKDPWFLTRVKKEMAALDAAHCTVAQAPGNDFLVGKTLEDVKNIYGTKDSRDALFRLMVATGLRGTMLYKVLDEDLIRKALASRHSFVASNAPSFSDAPHLNFQKMYKTERTTSTFSMFLSLAEHGLMPLEDAVRKITIQPAREFNLAGRGEIKEGNFADLACFRGGEVKFTVVNGRVAVREGEFLNQYPGKALRHISA